MRSAQERATIRRGVIHMHHRLVQAALVCLAIGFCSAAQAQSEDMPEQKYTPPEPAFVATPIKDFADAAGRWYGWVDSYTRVVLQVGPDGAVRFWGPRDLTRQAVIQGDRLLVQSPSANLDCGIMNGFLTCHARFGTWYAELNLRKQ